jgi:hypothetical protein
MPLAPLVVDDDEGGDVLDFDLPDGLHTEFSKLQDFDFFDAVLGKSRRRTTDGPEVEAAVLFASFSHRATAIALG